MTHVTVSNRKIIPAMRALAAAAVAAAALLLVPGVAAAREQATLVSTDHLENVAREDPRGQADPVTCATVG